MSKMSKRKLVIKSVAVEVSTKAFLPEAYVYRDMFTRHGVRAKIIGAGDPEILKYDAVVLFHGFHPFWKRYPKVVIGEYHSLSVGRFGRIKDLFKRALNVRADYYIVLSELVKKKFWLSRKSNLSIRGMGYSGVGDGNHDGKKEFDVVYCGSYREGLFDVIKKIANLGAKVALVGMTLDVDHPNVKSFGKVDTAVARNIMIKAKYGLNFTPDVFPLNVQDSTKVIEYSGLGLGVVTNSYFWIREFEKNRNGRFLYLEDVKSYQDIINFSFEIPDVSELEWKYISENLFDELSGAFEFSD